MIFHIAEAMLTFDSMTGDRLQKLCYFSYSWYLTFFGERLFEQRFEAWERGPVCPELYEKFGKVGLDTIPRIKKSLSEIIPDEDLQEFLLAVYDAHRQLDSNELIILACSEEPWLAALNRMGEGEGSVYEDEDIVNWNTKKILKEMKKENVSFIYNL